MKLLNIILQLKLTTQLQTCMQMMYYSRTSRSQTKRLD